MPSPQELLGSEYYIVITCKVKTLVLGPGFIHSFIDQRTLRYLPGHLSEPRISGTLLHLLQPCPGFLVLLVLLDLHFKQH